MALSCNIVLASRSRVFPPSQPKTPVSKTLSDTSEIRSKNVESERKQKSKSEGYPVLYEDRWYSISSFPRLCYHHHLLCNVVKKIRAFRQFEETCAPIGVNRVQLYIAGEITSETEMLITSSKDETRGCFSRDEKRWPVSALIYFQSDDEPINQIENLIDSIRPAVWTKAFIVRNQCTRPDEVTAESKYPSLCRRKTSVQEELTSFLETPLKEYIQGFLEGFKGSLEGIPEIRNECLSLLSQMSPETNSKNESQIPQIVKEFLFQKSGIHSFGIWDSSNFRVFIENSAEIEPLKSELYKLSPEFFNEISLNIVSDKLKIHSYVKQGDKIYFDRKGDNTQLSYATAGALLKDNGKDDIYGLTCHHALTQEKQQVYIISPETSELSKVGECVYSDTKPLHDFAVFKIEKDRRRNCDTTFLNRMENLCNVKIHQGIIPSNAVVHKKGATTNFTDGRILSSEFYSKLFGNRKEMFPVSFLVSSFESNDHPFSAQGDSGSVVFQHDKSPDQRSVFALGLVTGGINEVRDESSTEVLNATVCLRLNTALSRLSEKKQLNLKFDNSRCTSFSEDESE